MPHGFNLGPSLAPGSGTAGGAPLPHQNPPAPPQNPNQITSASDAESIATVGDFDDPNTAGGYPLLGGVVIASGYLLYTFGPPLVRFVAHTPAARRFALQVAFSWPGLLFPFKGKGHGDTVGDTAPFQPQFGTGAPSSSFDSLVSSISLARQKVVKTKISIHDIDQAQLTAALDFLNSLTNPTQKQQALLAALLREQQKREAHFKQIMDQGNGLLAGKGRVFPMWAADP